MEAGDLTINALLELAKQLQRIEKLSKPINSSIAHNTPYSRVQSKDPICSTPKCNPSSPHVIPNEENDGGYAPLREENYLTSVTKPISV